MVSRPNTTISKLPVAPSSLGSQSCSHSLRKLTAVAPNTAPQTAEAPPSTAMNRYSMPWPSPNGVGLTKRCRWAYSQPETQANWAAIMNSTMR
jgi:hypothetical protein